MASALSAQYAECPPLVAVSARLSGQCGRACCVAGQFGKHNGFGSLHWGASRDAACVIPDGPSQSPVPTLSSAIADHLPVVPGASPCAPQGCAESAACSWHGQDAVIQGVSAITHQRQATPPQQTRLCTEESGQAHGLEPRWRQRMITATVAWAAFCTYLAWSGFVAPAGAT